MQIHLSNYTDAHWKAAKRILIYLKNTTDIKLRYTRIPEAEPLEVYTDSVWAGCQETRRSTSGGIIFAYGNPVAWYSEKQGCVTGSSSEAEYVALNSALKEANYFINIMQQEMGVNITPALTHIDNMGAGFMAEQKICNKRSKHIDIKYHCCREQIQEFKNFDLNYVQTENNVSDIFTKPLDAQLHHKHRNFVMEVGKPKYSRHAANKQQLTVSFSAALGAFLGSDNDSREAVDICTKMYV